MAVSFQPHAFAAEPFESDLAAGVGMVTALVSRTVDEPSFDWSLDGTDDGEFICERVDDRGEPIGSLVDVVRAHLDPSSESATLLSLVSVDEGRLKADPPYVGFLLPEEIRRVATLLGGTVLADPDAERDRLLLLRLFETTFDASLGLYWLAL